jgi:hypothetical protein
MRIITSILTLFFLIVLLSTNAGQAGEGKKAIKATQKWSGKIADPTLRSAAPKSGYLLNQKAFEELWTKWMLKDKAPEVDFDKQIVLVHLAGGPNTPSASYTLEKGDLRAKVLSTLIAGPGFGYSIEVLPKEGVKTYQGKAIE